MSRLLSPSPGNETSDKKLSASALRMTSAYRNGSHATVYDVQRDPSLSNREIIRDKNKKVFPFVAGSNYKGEWLDDQKHGFGTQINSDGSKYEGEWKYGKYDGKGTLWIKKKKIYIREYVGEWSDGFMQGEGAYYYDNGEIYQGEWKNSKRHGSGRLDFVSGDYYIGEWQNDKQHGFGSLYLKNGNIYVGLWMNGLKEGPGKFFYAATKKLYEGEWANDQARCGEYRDALTQDEMNQFGVSTVRTELFDLPELQLDKPKAILDMSIADVRLSNVSRRGIGNNYIDEISYNNAKKMFSQLDTEGTGLVSVYSLSLLFNELNLSLTSDDMTNILRQLDFGDSSDISFSEAIDIATFLLDKFNQ
jgi:hypothetical protein